VLLPCQPRAEAQEPGSARARHLRVRARCCSSTDDESVRAVGRKMLERIGFRGMTVGRAEAIARFRERADDIICAIVDLTMPPLDGPKPSRAARLRPGGARHPVERYTLART